MLFLEFLNQTKIKRRTYVRLLDWRFIDCILNPCKELRNVSRGILVLKLQHKLFDDFALLQLEHCKRLVHHNDTCRLITANWNDSFVVLNSRKLLDFNYNILYRHTNASNDWNVFYLS